MTHELVNPDALEPAVGFAHAVVAAPGRLVFLGGQVGHGADGTIVGTDLAQQFDVACGNLVAALEAAGGRPEDLVSMQIFVTDAGEYRSRLKEIGKSWRRHLGTHYPAAGLFEITAMFDPEAKVELMGVAVLQE